MNRRVCSVCSVIFFYGTDCLGQLPTSSLMVERALDNGDSTLFYKHIQDYNIELWTTGFLFDHIERDVVYKTRERCDAHYELVRDLLVSSIEDDQLDWYDDDDILQQWINLLVERKYPWFVCSVWNHLRPIAISFLHHASMVHCHTGNLHQLLRQGLIAHLWEDVDFMASLEQNSSFFVDMEYSNKSFLKTFRKQIQQFPFHD